MRTAALAATTLVALARAALVEKWYDVGYMDLAPDGYTRRGISVNGTWPPPPLEVRQNDTVRIHVNNYLEEPTAIHHHGMFFNKTSYYDGAMQITQCGIPVNDSLTYEIPVDREYGTYWWHSHALGQYADGLRAPFIIHRDELHEYDDEFTIVLGDWYHEEFNQLEGPFMSKYNPSGAEPVPEFGYIYVTHNGTNMPGLNMDTGIPFEAGKTYRLRIINTSAFAQFYIWMDGHQMRVIEADGTDTEEYPVDYINLSVAQRYSVLVTARNDTDMNYLITAKFDETMFDTFSPDLQLNYTTLIKYADGNPVAETTVHQELNAFRDDYLVPLEVEPELTPARPIELGVWFDTFDNGQNRAAFNNITFQMPTNPTIFTATTMGDNAALTDVYGRQTNAHILEHNEIVDIMLINWDANAHPVHLHGHKFQIVRHAIDVASNDTTLNPSHVENLANPMRRDTVIIPAGGAVNLRIRADNPGVWILHCHIEWHLVAGFAMVFIEAPQQMQEQLQIPQVMMDQCRKLGIEPSGNVESIDSTTDLGAYYAGPNPQVLGWTPKGIGALAGTIIAAVLGMLAVVWYAFVGGQIDESELEQEVREEYERKEAKKAQGGFVKRAFKKSSS